MCWCAAKRRRTSGILLLIMNLRVFFHFSIKRHVHISFCACVPRVETCHKSYKQLIIDVTEIIILTNRNASKVKLACIDLFNLSCGREEFTKRFNQRSISYYRESWAQAPKGIIYRWWKITSSSCSEDTSHGIINKVDEFLWGQIYIEDDAGIWARMILGNPRRLRTLSSI